MRCYSLYSVKIKHYNHILKETISLYRKAADFFLQVCLKEWDVLSTKTTHQKLLYMEQLCHQTKKNSNVKYEAFDQKFYKFPSYLRRAAITEAIGKVSSYKSNLEKLTIIELQEGKDYIERKTTTHFGLIHQIVQMKVIMLPMFSLSAAMVAWAAAVAAGLTSLFARLSL